MIPPIGRIYQVLTVLDVLPQEIPYCLERTRFLIIYLDPVLSDSVIAPQVRGIWDISIELAKSESRAKTKKNSMLSITTLIIYVH